MREKLIELLIDGLGESEILTHMYGEPMGTDFQKFADYLLENGVVMLPCKVGDTVYYPYKYHNKVLKHKVKQIIINDKGKWLDVGVMWFSFEDIGTAVFLTCEEAEKALERSKK